MTKTEFINKIKDCNPSEGWSFDWYFGDDPSGNKLTCPYFILLRNNKGDTVDLIKNGRYKGDDPEGYIHDLITKLRAWAYQYNEQKK